MQLNECLERARAHVERAITTTQRRTGGSYWRNIPDSDVSLRYGDANARWGRRVRCSKWESNSDDGVSVNCCDCCAAPLCSVLMHAEPDRYDHTVRLDLAALSAAIEMEVEAVHTPLSVADDGAENPCHYLLLPSEGNIHDLFVKLNRLAHDDFPRKKPSTDNDRAIWEEANRRLVAVIQLELNVRPSV
jgi:hypothetical protein